MIFDYEVCECGNIIPQGCVCKCKVNEKAKAEVQTEELKLLSDILVDIDTAMPSRPITARAIESWENKYSDLLYLRKIIEEKRKKIINGGG